MYIDYLYLNNFTVFKTLNIEFSKGVNIFIGENGTGKTHLLKLYMQPAKQQNHKFHSLKNWLTVCCQIIIKFLV